MMASVWGADIIDLSGWPFYRWVINRVLKNATHITATSEFLEKAAVGFNPIVTRKISVIPFGVEVPDEIEPLPPHRPFKLCFIKSLRPKYGPDILLSAVNEVKKQIADIQLTMAGDGPMKERLEWIIKELELESNVTLAGFVPNQKVYNLIRQHHAMVMPSIMDSESFGVAAIEAGACGRPVIASRVGGVPEVIVDSRTGLLVPPKDHLALAQAIIKLASDINLCDKMGREGYEFVRQHYQWAKSLDLMCELYERVIHDSRQI
jgi:glycosyltransferase involved in cell wall biosynthesis